MSGPVSAVYIGSDLNIDDLGKVFLARKKTRPMKFRLMIKPFVVETKYGDQKGRAGDYLVEAAGEGLFVCEGELFRVMYERCD